MAHQDDTKSLEEHKERPTSRPMLAQAPSDAAEKALGLGRKSLDRSESSSIKTKLAETRQKAIDALARVETSPSHYGLTSEQYGKIKALYPDDKESQVAAKHYAQYCVAAYYTMKTICETYKSELSGLPYFQTTLKLPLDALWGKYSGLWFKAMLTLPKNPIPTLMPQDLALKDLDETIRFATMPEEEIQASFMTAVEELRDAFDGQTQKLDKKLQPILEIDDADKGQNFSWLNQYPKGAQGRIRQYFVSLIQEESFCTKISLFIGLRFPTTVYGEKVREKIRQHVEKLNSKATAIRHGHLPPPAELRNYDAINRAFKAAKSFL